MLRPSQVMRLTRSARSMMEHPHRRLVSLSPMTSSMACGISTITTTAATATTTTAYPTSTKTDNSTWRRQFHGTPYCWEEEKDKKSNALADDDDTDIPPWQNPLHHNNPDMQKIFAEDFGEDEEMPILPLPPLEEEPGKTLAPPHVHDLAHQIVHLTLLELRELTSKISDHFGFDDDMMAASYGGDMASAGAAEPAEEVKEEKTIFDVKLVGFDAKAKIKVIKEIRAISGLGLKEAKELVESAPKVVQKDLKQDKADELKAQLEAVGAQVEIV